MVAPLVLVGKEESYEMWVTLVSAAESLEDLDFSFIFNVLLGNERLDREVLLLSAGWARKVVMCRMD